MARKATQLLREAAWRARTDPTAALGLVAEAGDWAVAQRQVNLIGQAARLWEALGGDLRVSGRWRDAAWMIRAERRALYGRRRYRS